MRNGTIPLGRVSGTDIRVHWTALAIAAVLANSLIASFGVVVAVVSIIGFFAAVLMHELAHAAVARRFDIGTSNIVLWGLGGLARLDREPTTPRADGWIAAAGPLSNAVVGAVAAGVAWTSHRAGAADDVVVCLTWFAVVNLALAAFNILPGSPLDGGRVLRAVRWSRHGNRYRAMREAGYAGSVLGWALAAFGVSFMATGRSGFWMLLSGVFVLVSAKVEIATASIGERLGPLKVNQFTWYGVAEAGPDMDVDSMIWQRRRLGGAGAVAVRAADGSLGGLVLEDQLWDVPADSRESTLLTSIMSPFDRLPRADVDDDLASVLTSVHPRRPIVTVWRKGRLLGVIPPTVLQERIQALLASITPH
ncbi:site-2 protease family protein [soil metagenome]